MKEAAVHDTFSLNDQAQMVEERRATCPVVHSLAWCKLVAAVDSLGPLHRLVLDAQIGRHGSVADVTTIADRLSLPVERVDQLLDEALEELAWALLWPAAGVPAEAVA
jgi:hypothetical protein